MQVEKSAGLPRPESRWACTIFGTLAAYMNRAIKHQPKMRRGEEGHM